MSPSEKQRFLSLYQSHQSMVRGLLYQMIDKNLLDDLVQESFIKIWKALPNFSYQSSEKTWIYRIVINTALDEIRKNKSRKVLALAEYNDEISSSENSPSEDRSHQVQWALQQLDETHRAVVVLHYYEEIDLNEIAAILEIPQGTVKSRLFHARKLLKGLLIEEGDIYDVAKRT